MLRRSWRIRCCCALLCGALCLGPAGAAALTTEEQALQAAYERGEVLRLHVLASADTPRAQALKLIARDAALKAFHPSAADADGAYASLCEQSEALRAAAEQAVCALGFTGPVTAEVGELELPERRYGAVTLPEGRYRGLRLTLGEGRGRNWWCVLFPSLCLSAVSEEPWQSESDGAELLWDTRRILLRWLGPLEDEA